MKQKRFFSVIVIISFIIVLFDQLSKYIVNITLKLNSSKEIIHNFFSITNTHNYGAAWSILWDKRIGLVLIGLLTLILIIFLIYKEKVINKYKAVYYGLLIGGIIGNLIDRIVLGYVIDFFDFTIFKYNYPIFNISDIAIVTSVLLICIECFFKKESNNKKVEVEVLDFNE